MKPFLAICLPLLTAHVLVRFVIYSYPNPALKTGREALIRSLLMGGISYLFLGILSAWNITLGVVFSTLIVAFLFGKEQRYDCTYFLLYLFLLGTGVAGQHPSGVLLGCILPLWTPAFIVEPLDR
ncbi:MAG: hypothetical protein R6U57_10475 [Anaerolineales bacterium]